MTTTRSSSAVAAASLIAGTVLVPLVFWIGTDESFIVPKLVTASLIVAVAAVQLASSRPRATGGIHPVDLAVAAWILLVVLSFLTSVDQEQSWWGEQFQRQGTYTSLLYAATYGVARIALADRLRARLSVVAISIAATAVALYGLAQRLGIDPIWDDIPANRIFATIGQTNSLAAFLALAIPLTIVLAVLSTTRRVVFVGAATTQIAALGLTLSRGGYLALIVGAALLLIFTLTRRGWQWQASVAVTASLAMTGLVFATITPGADSVSGRVIDRAVSDDEWSTGSIRNHVDLWIVAHHIIADNPVVGTGPSTYPEVFGDYRDDVLSDDSARRLRVYRVESPHNIVLTTAQGSGIPAAAALLTALFLATRLAIRRGVTNIRDRGEHLWLGIGTAIISGFFASMFITADFSTTWLTWLLVGAVVANNPPSKSKSEPGADFLHAA